MLRQQSISSVIFQNGESVSSSINKEGYAWFTVEVPSGDEAAAVTVQIQSGDGSTWIDALTLADTSNRIKGLSSVELAALGPVLNIRLKLASAVSGEKKYFLHMSS